MKNLLNLGKALSKAEQKSINGGKAQCIVPGSGGICSLCGPQCYELECQEIAC